jgi:hypothetical protein
MRAIGELRGDQAGDRRVAVPTMLRGGLLKCAPLAAAAALCALFSGPASAIETARIDAGFAPERLGAPTTISFGFEVKGSAGELPAPITGIDFGYPANLGIATSGLGTAACSPVALQIHGPAVCPGNSLMGYGSALVDIPVGPDLLEETARIASVAGPSPDGSLRVLIGATGESPVAARIVIPTVLADGRLDVAMPLIPGLPEGPDVSVVKVHVTIGGNLTYHEQVHGRTIAYHPKGFSLPRVCPRGGFRFTATFAFLDGNHAHARAAVACPRGRR